jgi:Tannase and feruloyl esterase
MLFHQSHQQYDSVLGTADADLSAFRARGGKMLTWQGLADNFIMPNGTMEYYDRVGSTLGTSPQDFYRAFFAPGVGHCGGGMGVLPDDILGALRTWVEHGVVPDTLAATSQWNPDGIVRKQNLCPYPMVNKYKGSGDPSVAANYLCADGF